MRTKSRMLKASPATFRGHFSHFKYLFASAISKTVLLTYMHTMIVFESRKLQCEIHEAVIAGAIITRHQCGRLGIRNYVF